MSQLLLIQRFLSVTLYLFLLLIDQEVTSFSTYSSNSLHQKNTNRGNYNYLTTTKGIDKSRRYMVPVVPMHDVTTIVTGVVEFFDGSTIVDPVVVSNVFWSRLQANIISILIGQVLAAITFSFLLSIATAQITKALAYINEQLFSKSSTNPPNLRIPSSLRDDTTIPSSDTTHIEPDLGKLLLCIAIDTIGSSSVLLPIIGDASDMLWAPTAGFLLRYLFYNSNIILILEFTEEILPLTDILPLATLCWIIDTYLRESKAAKLLQLGKYAPSTAPRDRADD